MCSLSALVDKVAGPVSDYVCQKVVLHVSYVVRYKKNMKDLQDEKKRLEKQMGKNAGKIEQADIQGEIVEEDVKEWAQMAEKMKHEIEELMDSKAINESMKCLKISCPNLISRYRMSKQSEQRLHDLKGHIQGGNFDIVAHRAPPPPELQFTSSGNFVYYDSREPVLEKIKDGLTTPTCNTIGVYGTGGIGKTKAVEEVAKRVRKDGSFDEVVIAVVSQDVNIHRIQGVIAGHLKLSFQSDTVDVRKGELWNRLNNGRNNLIILDDVWQELDLKAIGIPLRDGNKGCKVILTTRNLDVLRKMKVDVYVPVNVLSETESWDLFKKKVDFTLLPTTLHPIAKLICKECRGLPVAILAVGGALAGKDDKHDWNDTLNQLQNSMWQNIDGIDPKMYTSIRLSYDYLRKEVRSILLLCCLYPEDSDIPVESLLFHCIARRLLDPSKNTVEKARDRTFSLVSSLKTRSLLLDGILDNSVRMHDVVRDVVISIARNEEQYLVKDAINEWPHEYMNENLAAISLRFNKWTEVPDVLACPQLHTLRIESSDDSSELPDNFFVGVGELSVLELKQIQMLSVPSSLANLYKLRTIILVKCLLDDMSLLKGLKNNLEVLIIEGSSIEALPVELGELRLLRVLLLNNSYRLGLIPPGVISKLTHLEELGLPDNFMFGKGPSSTTLSELSSLTRLTSLSILIPNHEPVPDICFGKLVNYRLAVGECLSKWLICPKKRCVNLYGVVYSDMFTTLLERASVVHLCRVDGLKKGIIDSGLLEVEDLVVSNCNGLDSFSSGMSFSKLTVLHIDGCSFKFLFTISCARRLQLLETLTIRYCYMLEEVIGTEGEKDDLDQSNRMVHFSKLKELTLEYLPKLLSFGPKGENTTAEGISLPKGQPLFSENVTFCALEILKICDCFKITEIWDKGMLPTGYFPQLVVVDVCDCGSLVNVFPFKMRQNLKTIIVHFCRRVEYIISDNGIEEQSETITFPYLDELSLSNLTNFKSFSGNSTTPEPHCLFKPRVRFSVLRRLSIDSCDDITELWDKAVLPTENFPQLVDVNVINCDNLVNVFPFKVWQNLKRITVGNCGRVEFIISDHGIEEQSETITFPHLQELSLSYLTNIKSFCGNSTTSDPQCLFKPRVTFLSLKDLRIYWLENITGIWDKEVVPTTSFPRLSDVAVSYCDKLVNVFPSYSWAQSLQNVYVYRCQLVKVVFSMAEEEANCKDNNSIVFPQLQSIDLDTLQELEGFCGNPTTSDPLDLFNPKFQFPALENVYLKLSRVETFMEQVLARKIVFPAIQKLEVNGQNIQAGNLKMD